MLDSYTDLNCETLASDWFLLWLVVFSLALSFGSPSSLAFLFLSSDLLGVVGTWLPLWDELAVAPALLPVSLRISELSGFCQ